jgi:hypothetical protein
MQAAREEQQRKKDEKVRATSAELCSDCGRMLKSPQARVLQQIENDKLERAARAGRQPAQPAPPASKSASEAALSPRGNGSSRLCFRLQDGSSLKEQFDTKQTCAMQPASQSISFISYLLISVLFAASAIYSSGSTVACRQGATPACPPHWHDPRRHHACVVISLPHAVYPRQYIIIRHMPAMSYNRSDTTTLDAAGALP